MLRTEGKKFSIMTETPVTICFVIPQCLYAKFVVFYNVFKQSKHGCLLITYDIPFSHNTSIRHRHDHRRLEC